jgi:hypothetical protein
MQRVRRLVSEVQDECVLDIPVEVLDDPLILKTLTITKVSSPYPDPETDVDACFTFQLVAISLAERFAFVLIGKLLLERTYLP